MWQMLCCWYEVGQQMGISAEAGVRGEEKQQGVGAEWDILYRGAIWGQGDDMAVSLRWDLRQYSRKANSSSVKTWKKLRDPSPNKQEPAYDGKLIWVGTSWYWLIRVDTGWFGLICVDTGWQGLKQDATKVRKANCLRVRQWLRQILVVKIASHLKKACV